MYRTVRMHKNPFINPVSSPKAPVIEFTTPSFTMHNLICSHFHAYSNSRDTLFITFEGTSLAYKYHLCHTYYIILKIIQYHQVLKSIKRFNSAHINILEQRCHSFPLAMNGAKYAVRVTKKSLCQNSGYALILLSHVNKPP